MSDVPKNSGAPASRQRQSDGWRALPNGVECDWRSRDRVIVAFHAVLFVEFGAFFSWLVVGFVAGFRDVLTDPRLLLYGAPVLLFFGTFTWLFGLSTLQSFRGRGQPSRLRATVDEGIQFWRRANLRPHIDVPRDAIEDVRVEGGPRPWWPWRQWRLVIRLNTGWRTSRVVFESSDRVSLDNTCSGLRHGVGLPN